MNGDTKKTLGEMRACFGAATSAAAVARLASERLARIARLVMPRPRPDRPTVPGRAVGR